MARRRRKFTWLPSLGTGNPVINFSDNAFREGTLTVPNDGSTSVGIIPLTFDQPFEGGDQLAADTSLADVVGSEYIIERIVGNVFTSLITDTTAIGSRFSTGAAVVVGAGFFVARANDEQVGGGVDTPIGSATAAERAENYNPIGVSTVREPWMWRRLWLLGLAGNGEGPRTTLGNPTIATNSGNQLLNRATTWPNSNAFFPSPNGPFLDSPSKRRVGQDERLFFALSATNHATGLQTTGTTLVAFLVDYRILGQIVRARQHSSF